MQKSKKEIIKDLKISSKDVGSSEVQIGLLSEKINNLTNHFNKNKNGSTVIATASSEDSREQCVKAGADLVVGHPSDETVNEIIEYTNGKKIDRIIEGDFGANLLPVLDILKTSGTIATYSSMTDMNPSIPFIRMMFMDITIRMVLVYAMPDQAKAHAAKDITTMLSQNSFANRVAREYSLDNISDAHNMIESGEAYGSVIIKP